MVTITTIFFRFRTVVGEGYVRHTVMVDAETTEATKKAEDAGTEQSEGEMAAAPEVAAEAERVRRVVVAGLVLCRMLQQSGHRAGCEVAVAAKGDGTAGSI